MIMRALFPVLGLPVLLARTLGALALLFFATFVLALLGFTEIAGESHGWARALAIVSGAALLLVLFATVVLVRKAVGYVRQGRELLRRRRG
jgi:hypothetical protein